MYIVIEIQTNADGTVGNFVTAFDNANQAYGQYYKVLAVAAVSAVKVHTAVLLFNDGTKIDSKSFTHEG